MTRRAGEGKVTRRVHDTQRRAQIDRGHVDAPAVDRRRGRERDVVEGSNGEAAAFHARPQDWRRHQAGCLARGVQRPRDALAIQTGDTRRPRQIDPRLRADVDAGSRRDHVDRSLECEPPFRRVDRECGHEQAGAVEREPARHGPRQRGLWLEADGERAGPERVWHGRRRGRVDRQIDRAHHERSAAQLIVDARRQLPDVDAAQAQRRHVR